MIQPKKWAKVHTKEEHLWALASINKKVTVLYVAV